MEECICTWDHNHEEEWIDIEDPNCPVDHSFSSFAQSEGPPPF